MNASILGYGAESVLIDAAPFRVAGETYIPHGAEGLVACVYGPERSEGHDHRSTMRAHARRLTHALHEARFGTLLVQIFATEGESMYREIERRARRMQAVTRWFAHHGGVTGRKIGCIAAGSASAVMLAAAPDLESEVGALVSLGSRPDLAGHALGRIRQPTLLIVGAEDAEGIARNRLAFDALDCEKKLLNVPGASEQFAEPGAIEMAEALARDWFRVHLTAAREPGPSGLGAR